MMYILKNHPIFQFIHHTIHTFVISFMTHVGIRAKIAIEC